MMCERPQIPNALCSISSRAPTKQVQTSQTGIVKASSATSIHRSNHLRAHHDKRAVACCRLTKEGAASNHFSRGIIRKYEIVISPFQSRSQRSQFLVAVNELNLRHLSSPTRTGHQNKRRIA